MPEFERNELNETGKMLALTLVLTNLLLLLIVGVMFWLVQTVISTQSRLSEIPRSLYQL